MTQASPSALADLVQTSRVIIILGAGGVGKTTTAVGLAVLAAMQGRKVGLLSIDPAKRLAAAMGLSLGSELKDVAFPPTLHVPGTLKAAMLDQKAVFDEMVRRYAPNERVVERIYTNSVYKEVSTNLGGPLEYMAIAKLQQMLDDGGFDLVVLDTPPDTHALDFLARPNILAGFMESRVMTWLIKPFHLARRLGVGRIFTAGEKLMGGIAAVTGVKALQTLAEFLVLMEDVIMGFHRSGERLQRILRAPDTSFTLVTAPKSSAMRSAANIVDQLARLRYDLKTILVNRYLPESIVESVAYWRRAAPDVGTCGDGLAALERQSSQAEASVRRLTAHAQATLGRDVPTVVVAEQERMIHSKEAICALAEVFAKSPVF